MTQESASSRYESNLWNAIGPSNTHPVVSAWDLLGGHRPDAR